jgi:hypothetical protein
MKPPEIRDTSRVRRARKRAAPVPAHDRVAHRSRHHAGDAQQRT